MGPLPTPRKSDDVPVAIDVWGEPVDGVQLGLAVSSNEWAYPGELPPLDMRLHNARDRDIVVVPGMIGRCAAIEIDGVWHSPMACAGGNERWYPLPPRVETANILFDVSAFDLDGRGHYVPLSEFGIRSGSHVLRVRALGGVYDNGSTPMPLLSQPISLVSNSIVVDVAPTR